MGSEMCIRDRLVPSLANHGLWLALNLFLLLRGLFLVAMVPRKTRLSFSAQS